MSFKSEQLNDLIDEYGDAIIRNKDDVIKVFIDEVITKDGIESILIFCKEKDTILNSDSFIINNNQYFIKEFIHHTSNHYEVLLNRLVIMAQPIELIIYNSTITFNNCQILTTDKELLRTKKYTLSTIKPIKLSGSNVLSSSVNTLVTVDYNVLIKVGTILVVGNSKLEVMQIENVKLESVILKLHCKQVTNVAMI